MARSTPRSDYPRYAISVDFSGGIQCGGEGGGGDHEDGFGATCAGGGGGGGGSGVLLAGTGGQGTTVEAAAAADQSARRQSRWRDNGGFGGGGGAGWQDDFGSCGSGSSGGDGGFGGGGGAGPGGQLSGGAGHGGLFWGNASCMNGGGGGALGGAIFSDGGIITIENSTFTGNTVTHGLGGGLPALDGGDAGGAIFASGGGVFVHHSTISGNQSTIQGGGIVVSSIVIFELQNTIVSGNGPATASQCFVLGSATVLTGSGNAISSNNSNCPGIVTTVDPQVRPLQLNSPGITPTMAISKLSSAFNNADPNTSLTIDQRGLTRPRMGGFDIGAFELCVDLALNPCQLPPLTAIPNTLTILVTPAGAGTTTPPEGKTDVFPNAVQTLTATPNAGYAFLNWTGNVVEPTSQATAIIMTQDQDVTANFIPCTCAGNVSTSVSVKRLGFVLNPATRRYAQTVTVTNTSAHPITGPISLVLDNLSANVTLFNASGTTDSLEPPAGSPYMNANVSLGPGQSVSFALQFTDPTNAAISYTTRVLAGPGSR